MLPTKNFGMRYFVTLNWMAVDKQQSNKRYLLGKDVGELAFLYTAGKNRNREANMGKF